MMWRMLGGLKRQFFMGVLLACMIPGSALAIQGIGISPTSQEVELAPGASTKGELTIINDGDTDILYKVYASDYKVTGDSYHGDFNSSGAAANVSPVSWFGLPKGSLTVKARNQVKLSYSLTVPKTATVGGHYGAIFAETIPPPGRGGAIVSRIDRLGSLFYIAVSGDLKKSGSVLPLKLNWLQYSSPIAATLKIKNEGNVHFLAEGTIQLSSIFGKDGRPVQFRGEVLPSTTRRFELSLAASTPIGLYKVTAKPTYLGQTKEVSRWVLLMPRVTFMVICGTLVLIIGLGLWLLIKRLRRRSA